MCDDGTTLELKINSECASLRPSFRSSHSPSKCRCDDTLYVSRPPSPINAVNLYVWPTTFPIPDPLEQQKKLQTIFGDKDITKTTRREIFGASFEFSRPRNSSCQVSIYDLGCGILLLGKYMCFLNRIIYIQNQHL